MGVANTLDRFVAVEDNFPHQFDKCMEKVLVELDNPWHALIFVAAI